MPSVPIALQLYTVRDELAKDFEGTLRGVAEIGYVGVEFAGFGGLPASRIWSLLQDLNLRATGAHIPLEELENNLEAVVDFNLEIGSGYLVVPWLPEERRRDRKKWRAVAHGLDEIGKDIRDYGLNLCYHNHAFEFEKLGGQYAFDILFDTADPELVAAEIDTYWVKYAGEDPADCIRRLAGRCPLIHLKDMADDEQRSNVEVGQGILDFDTIFEAAEAGNVEWYIVEQDTCARPPLESARLSFENLKARGKV
ncbi:hypothetical protein AMJ85_07260 [candidate division BRC1 bacterium SM23_51]|nr:MAG: hypothetical protein AMJ85_07260 [candidate division BRC1 bacterium SM23_51]